MSADTPAAHAGLIEQDGLAYELLSDPDTAFYVEAGIIEPSAESVHRGVIVYGPDGTIQFREVTDDPASVLLDFLEI